MRRGPRAKILYLAVGLFAAFGLIGAGCGGDDDGGDGGGGESGTYSFSVAVVDPDLGSIALLEAIDVLRENGHDVESPEVAEPELAIEGIARDRFQFSGETTSSALSANQEGAPVVLIGDLVGNVWSVWATDEIESCEDLDGQRFGIFSQGSVATAMVKNWVEDTCPGTQPKYLVLGDSSTRLAALEAGEIAGTALSLGDTLQIESESLHQLVDFQEELPELRPSTLYANSEYIEQEPEATQAFIDAVAEVDAQINEDVDYLAGLIREHLPDTESVEEIAEEHSGANLYDVTALNADNLEYTIDFFERAGSIEPGLTVEDVANFSFIEEVESSE